MTISVLTPVYAADPREPALRASLHGWLAHLAAQRGPLELVLAGTAPVRRDPWAPLLAELAGADYPHRWRTLHSPCRDRPQTRAAALNAAAAAATGEVFWLLHVDVWPPAEAADQVRSGAPVGAFAKRYDPSTPLLAAQAAWLNAVHLRLAGRTVGTNAVWLRRELWQPLPDQPLLEDVWLADRLPRPALGRGCVRVGSEKYLRTGVAASMAINALVLGLARLRLATPAALAEHLYSRRGLPVGSPRVWPALAAAAWRALAAD